MIEGMLQEAGCELPGVDLVVVHVVDTGVKKMVKKMVPATLGPTFKKMKAKMEAAADGNVSLCRSKHEAKGDTPSHTFNLISTLTLTLTPTALQPDMAKGETPEEEPEEAEGGGGSGSGDEGEEGEEDDGNNENVEDENEVDENGQEDTNERVRTRTESADRVEEMEEGRGGSEPRIRGMRPPGGDDESYRFDQTQSEITAGARTNINFTPVD